MSTGATASLCVVIPIFNEEENIRELVERLGKVFDRMTDVAPRALFVNDGSSDRSVPLLIEHVRADGRLALIDLSRNFGHQAALSAGLSYADADAVVLMDADLQDPPELIPEFVDRWRDGYEVVYAVRRKRAEGWAKRSAYRLFYRLNRAIAQVDMPLDAGDFCLMDRRVVAALTRMPEYNRFLRGLRAWVGFRQTRLEYDRPGRFAGTTKYSVRRLVTLALSGFIGFSTFPLRMAVWLGLFAAAGGILLACWVVAVKLMAIPAPAGWASLTAVVLFMGGVQLLVLGVFGEYLGNVNEEVRRRPVFIVRDVYGLDADLGRVAPPPRAVARGTDGEPRR